jgi:hypothetical protein
MPARRSRVFGSRNNGVTALTIGKPAPRTNAATDRAARCSPEPKETVMSRIRNAILGGAVVTALLASTSIAFATGTPEQRRACMGDAIRLCAAEIPNVSRITSCMRTNFSKLSPACKTVMMKG